MYSPSILDWAYFGCCREYQWTGPSARKGLDLEKDLCMVWWMAKSTSAQVLICLDAVCLAYYIPWFGVACRYLVTVFSRHHFRIVGFDVARANFAVTNAI